MAARLTKLFVLAALTLAVTASSGTAAGSFHPGILGVVPHGQPAPAAHALSKAIQSAAPAPLTFDTKYKLLIDRYFTDVAKDSGGTKNVYSVATQYTDDSGPVQYQSTFGGSYVAHDPLPANGCNDADAHTGLHDPYCLTNAQLQTEIQTAMSAQGWHGGPDHVFFLMTPNGVGSCFAAVSSTPDCSTNAFCAYHSAFGTLSNPVMYANEPYEGPLPRGDCTAPTQGFPNNDVDAETTINTISHEHNEAITDPLTSAGLAWITNHGNENGDLCAYGFGTQTGTGTSAYNQTINGHHYDLQQEYSNADNGCVQSYPGGTPTQPTTASDPDNPDDGPLVYSGGPVMHTNTTYAIYWLPRPGNTGPPVVTGTAAVNHTLTTSPGAWSAAQTGYHYQWQRCSSAGTSCVNISGATATTYKPTSADVGHAVRSTVVATNVNGSSAAAVSATTAAVIDIPAATKLPHISGHARVGKKLTGRHGSWTYAPTAYHLQWLRCNAHGAHCSSIRHATHPAYRLTKHDTKHRLRLRVKATNAAGTGAAISTASARVR